MAVQQITAADITSWNSLEDIAASFEKRGLKPQPELGEENRFVLELADGEFIELVQASTGKSATDYKPGSITRHTNLVATDDYETFTFITRVRDWDTHGRIKYQQFSFEKDQFQRDSGEKHTVLQKLNEIEYGQSAAVMDDLYDTRQIVKEFYEQFESLRTDLVKKVSGIPDDRDDGKQRYVQVLLDRMIFLYFIQEKNLLDYDAEYLHNHHEEVVSKGGDVNEDFYDPLFFDLLAEGKDDPEFGKLPYLNGGLFSKNPIEEEFENAKLGDDAEETNALFERILDFLSDWNWNVDERLDIVDPKNLSPAVLGHIFEQTVNQKEMGAYYTPEEITGFMARRTIHPYLLDQLNEAEGTSYESIDDVFSLDAASTEDSETEAIADGGTLAHEVDAGAIEQDHLETLYFDVLKETRVLDPAVGSGAFLLAAQEVLLDVYLQCIEYLFAKEENEPWELTDKLKNELDSIREIAGNEVLFAKREIILNNLYGVDIDPGAVEICKLRLWLSMVANIEDEPREVEPLPNIDFNIRQGDSLLGFDSTEVVTDGQKLLLTEFLKDELEKYRGKINQYRSAQESSPELRKEIESTREELQEQLNEWFANIPKIDVEEDISTPEELKSVVSSSDESIILKLKFGESIGEELNEKLNQIGFRTWKKAANIELENEDIVADKHREIFDLVTEDQLNRSFVQRGLFKQDIESLSPFHWIMEFPDAYLDEDEGFDIIIDNPPYVRLKSLNELQRDIYKDTHKTALKRCDLYIPFVERSFDLLCENGRNSIITSNQFMRTEYGETLRGYLPQNYGLEQIFDFTAYSAFKDVTIYSTILFGSRNVGSPIDCVSLRSEEAVNEVILTSFNWEPGDDIHEFTLPAKSLDTDRWLILDNQERQARNQMEENSDTTLKNEELFTVGSPLMSGQNTTLQAEIIDEKDKRYKIKNNRIEGDVKTDLWRKLTTSEDIERWNITEPSEVMFFPYTSENGGYELISEDILKEKYKNSYDLLIDYEEELLDRKDSRSTYKQLGRAWYCLGRVGTPANFDSTKVLTDIVVNEPHFCLDDDMYIFSHGYLHGITPHGVDPYFLTGLLNSKAIFSYLKPICPPKNSGYMKMEVDHLLDLARL